MSWLFFLNSDSTGLCFTLCCMSWLFPLTEAPLSRFCSMTQSDQSRNSPNSWHVFFQFILFLCSKQLYWRIERQYGGKMELDKKNGHTWGSLNADRFISAQKSGYIPIVKSFPSLFCFMTQCEQSDPLSYSLVIQSEPLPKSQSRLSYFLFQIGATTKKYIFLFSQPYCLSIRQFNCLEERKSREAHVVQIILYAKLP